MKSTFKRKFNSLGFTAPRWQVVNKNLFNPARWSKFRIRHLHGLMTRFRNSAPKKQEAEKVE